jgi:hypothetical protein
MEPEIVGESLGVALDGLIERLGRNPVKGCEFGVQDDPLTA